MSAGGKNDLKMSFKGTIFAHRHPDEGVLHRNRQILKKEHPSLTAIVTLKSPKTCSDLFLTYFGT